MRAVIRIEDAEVVDSGYIDQKGRAQKQFATELKVLSGAGERDGETFLQWFSFLASGEIGPKTKTGQMLTAALGEDARAETLEEFAAKLVGRTFAAQIGTTKDGQYARVVHDTISAAMVSRITELGERDWRALAWILERRFSGRWANRQRLEVMLEREFEAMLAVLEDNLEPQEFRKVVRILTSAGAEG